MRVDACRTCAGALTTFLDLGEQYLSDFRADDSKPPKYPLEASFCENCKLVQLNHNTPQPEMYHDNYGFKSGVSDSIKTDLDSVVTEAYQWVNDPKTWLDIASNDGTLLSYVPKDVYRVGVDPVKFLCEQAKPHASLIINDYFSRKLLAPLDTPDMWSTWLTFDVITSISCFYDMPDPNQFVEDVKLSLNPNGVWIIQQNYLLHTLLYKAVDNFCHEHLEYYTLHSLEYLLDKHDLEVVDVSESTVNGGSIRTVVAHRGAYEQQPSVAQLRQREDEAGVDKLETYQKFAKEIWGNIYMLRGLVELYKDQGKKVYILAASTRGATIWQTAGIGAETVAAAIERNPAKVGKNFSAVGIPIISEEAARSLKPDAMLVGPWFFAQEICDREKDYLANGGELIIPLPEIRIVRG